DAGKLAEEVVVPKRAAELAVGDRSQPDVLLFADHVLDLAVFDRRELGCGDLAALALAARRFEGGGAQQASHVIGAERRLGAGHRVPYLPVVDPGRLAPRVPHIPETVIMDPRISAFTRVFDALCAGTTPSRRAITPPRPAPAPASAARSRISL